MLVLPVSAQEPTPPRQVVETTVVETTPQVVEVAPRVVETTVEEMTPALPPLPPTPAQLDAAIARRQLGMMPRAIEVPPVHQPGDVVETTETTTVVETPGLPDRVYNSSRSVVITGGRELPYVTVPVLFEEGTAKLLDAASRDALEVTASTIKEILTTSPDALFDIEGHTSTDGDDAMNMRLSADRARRVHAELTRNYAVPVSALTAHGYGENYPNFPAGTEEQLVLDRRVLVVRAK